MDSGRGRRAGGNRGRSSRNGNITQRRHVPVEAGRHSTVDAFDSKDGTASDRMKGPKLESPAGIWKQSNHELTSGHAYKQEESSKDGTPSERREAPKQASPGSIWKQSDHEITSGHAYKQEGSSKDGTPSDRMEAPKQASPGAVGKQADHKLTSAHAYKEDRWSSGNKGLPHLGRNQHGKNPRDTLGSSSQPYGCSSASESDHQNNLSLLSDLSLKEKIKHLHNESRIQTQTPVKYGITNMPAQTKGPQFGKSSLNKTGSENIEHSEHPGVIEPFNICSVKTGTSVVLKSPLHSKNREQRKERMRAQEGQKGELLKKPGMVLLKSYIPLSDQVKIIKKCQELGLGSGGFYRPGYRDGAKLNLMMMCLGKNWDPETSKYGDERPVDNAKPPLLPDEFCQLVKEAIQESHVFLAKQKPSESKVEEIIPWMIPDICIVNFYSTTGRLGLHQDKDESPESLRKELPVVSFSIGNSAEFLYSDQRDVANAEKVILESGDVLIFGGKSRHIFHGVASVLPDTSPKILLEETNLRPGRLNLTFRQF